MRMVERDVPATIARAFIGAFEQNDLPALWSWLADGFTGHTTTADGGTRE